MCLLPYMPLGVLCAATCVPDALNDFGTKCVSCGPTRVCACCPHRPANLQSTLFNSLVENGKAQVRWCRSGAAQEYGCCICRCGGAGQGLGRSRASHARARWCRSGTGGICRHGRGGIGQGPGDLQAQARWCRSGAGQAQGHRDKFCIGYERCGRKGKE